jgi:hypothetical protein
MNVQTVTAHQVKLVVRLLWLLGRVLLFVVRLLVWLSLLVVLLRVVDVSLQLVVALQLVALHLVRGRLLLVAVSLQLVVGLQHGVRWSLVGLMVSVLEEKYVVTLRTVRWLVVRRFPWLTIAWRSLQDVLLREVDAGPSLPHVAAVSLQFVAGLLAVLVPHVRSVRYLPGIELYLVGWNRILEPV